MNPVEIIIGFILCAVILASIAQALRFPYPTVLVLGGLALGFLPGLPHIELPPDVTFLIFIPPLVYVAAARFGLHDLRRYLWPIFRLSVGLVMLTVVCVAAAAHWMFDAMSWPAAFVLAAIISPTDTAAVTAVTRSMSIPKRVQSILEGESMFNSVVALVAYKQAIQTTIGGSFSLHGAVGELLWNAIGGLVIGLLVGIAATWARHRVRDSTINTASSFLTPFAAYLGAESIHASGVLATVIAGLYVGHFLISYLKPNERVQAIFFWDGLKFILEGLAFILIGFQLRGVLNAIDSATFVTLCGQCAFIAGVTIAVRVIWIYIWYKLPRSLCFNPDREDIHPHSSYSILIAWSGMRGVDSLAAAMAIPYLLADGTTPFPQRQLIILLSFSVILATLVLQGLTLPRLIRWLNIAPERPSLTETTKIRLVAAEAAMRKLAELEQSRNLTSETLQHLRKLFQEHAFRYRMRLDSNNSREFRLIDEPVNELMLELLQAERQAVLEMLAQGLIDDETMRRFESSLDYEELRLMADFRS
jgi:Na+/H+ antiporter